MDPEKLIVKALAAGIECGAEKVTHTAVRDVYQELKQLVGARFAGSMTAKAALAGHERDQEAWRAALEKALIRTGASADRDVISAAQRLIALLDQASRATGEHPATAGGLLASRRATPDRPVPAPTPSPSGRPPSSRRAPPDLPRPTPTPSGRHVSSVGSRASSPETGGPDRVILIERSFGVQVGQGNDQYSAYLVTL